MHWQAAPYTEVKLIRCTRGAIWDVIVDLRQDSPTYTEHFGVELTAASGRALYVPEGMAHGFMTLADASEVLYQLKVDNDGDGVENLVFQIVFENGAKKASNIGVAKREKLVAMAGF